ncbi:tetratricopeptide repeat protein, partial [Komagataeibacter sp. FXV3]|uniref:tetratricopeptide repeat protein n=1 Tax=Komagataeibacter sp. FXV3 TaxID=2608998 RepID=UPI0038D0DA98
LSLADHTHDLRVSKAITLHQNLLILTLRKFSFKSHSFYGGITIDLSGIDEKALNVCLGDEWRHGTISHSLFARKITDPTTGESEVENCFELIFRLFYSARLQMDAQTSRAVARLSVSFAGLLSHCSRFKSGISFCLHAINQLDSCEEFRKETTSLRIKLAYFLRMKDRDPEAIEQCNLIDLSSLTNRQKQSVLMTRVLCYIDMGENNKALGHAREVIRIERNSASALHAQFVIAQNIEDKVRRIREFKKILKKSQKEDHSILSNNILIEMYDEEDDKLKSNILQDIMLHKNSDYYNFMRALSRYFPKNGMDKESIKNNTIEAYHFLSGQRLMGLFDRYHKKLWDIFEENSEYDNLIRLFRQSSFIWRLGDKVEIENKYLRRLDDILSSSPSRSLGYDMDSISYFFIRKEALLTLN